MRFLHDSDAYLGVVMILQAIHPPCGYNTCSNSMSFLTGKLKLKFSNFLF